MVPVLGDVVRIKSDQVIGTVVCVSRLSSGTYLLHLHTDGQGSREVGASQVEAVNGRFKRSRKRLMLGLLTSGVAASLLSGTVQVPGLF